MRLLFAVGFLTMYMALQAQESFTMTFNQAEGVWQGPKFEKKTRKKISPLDVLTLKVIYDPSYQANVEVKFPSLGSDSVEQFSFVNDNFAPADAGSPGLGVAGTKGVGWETEIGIPEDPIDTLITTVLWDTLGARQRLDLLYVLNLSVLDSYSSSSQFLGSQVLDTLEAWKVRSSGSEDIVQMIVNLIELLKEPDSISENNSVSLDESGPLGSNGEDLVSTSLTSTHVIPMSGISQGGLIIDVELINPTENDTIRTATWHRAQKDWKGHNAWSVGLTGPRNEFYSINVDSASFSIDARAMTYFPVIGTGLVFEQKHRNLATGVYLGLNYALDDEDQTGRVSASASFTLRPTRLPHIALTAGASFSESRVLAPGYQIDADYELIGFEDVPTLDDVLVKDYRLGWYVGLVLRNISRGAN